MAKSISTVFLLLSLVSVLPGCGGSKPAGASPFPGKITLTPSTSTSLQLGGIFAFVASAQNGTGTNISPAFTYQSSDTSILNMAPNGVACAGIWDAAFVNCTPGNYGVVQVTASALGATSQPTLVYVHPAIDDIKITFICPSNETPPACPGQQTVPAACAPAAVTLFQSCLSNVGHHAPSCISTNQTMTLQANAYSKGVDITAAVGPFTWSEGTTGVVNVTPFVTNTNTNIPTNQATVTANTPGFTPVFASASNVASQPYYAETCPVQCVSLNLGSQLSGNTSFAVTNSTNETIYATAVDVQGCVVPKPALTWTSTQPTSVAAGSSATGCAAGLPCAITTPQPGAASITASCTPPSCNVGFPQDVTQLPTGPVQLVQPVPVYPITSVSGLVSGVTSATSVLATSSSSVCAANQFCADNIYNVSTSKNISGNPAQLPLPLNSLIYDPAGDKAFAGGEFGSYIINPANLGSSTSPFTGLGTITGKILAVSPRGNFGIFSDTTHNPNEVYVVNTTNGSAAVETLNISGATAAAFSPDELKAFIIGQSSDTCTSPSGCLYIFSPVQALQTVLLSAPASGVTFSSTGAFAIVNGGSTTSSISVYNTCDNSAVSLLVTLPAAPLFLRTLPPQVTPPPITSTGLKPVCTPQGTNPPTYVCTGLETLIGLDNTGIDLMAFVPKQTTFPNACPQTIPGAPFSQHISLGQGTFNPINFFVAPDASAVYVVTTDHGILAYNFLTNQTSAFPLVGTSGQSVEPVAASMTVDGTLIYVAGTDGLLHEVNTTNGQDLFQIFFPNLTDFTNPFCSSGSSTIACDLNVVAVKP